LLLNVLPRSFRAKLPYAETFQFTTGAAGVAGTAQRMALNSLFDPNYTGVGHQPYGFDQISTWYRTYLVHAAKIKLTATSIGGSAEVAVLWKFDNPYGFTTLTGMTTDAATEAPMVGVGLLGASGNDRTFVKDLSVELHKVIGITKPQYVQEISTYGAEYTAAPSLLANFSVAISSFTGAAAEAATIQIYIEYDAEFFNPTQLAQS